MLSACELRLRRGGRAIVDDVSLDVLPGQVTALVGPSGAAKSTVLRLLSGDLHPGSGTIRLDGRSLAWHGPVGLARRRAVLPQESTLSSALSVLEVVLSGRAAHGDAGGPAACALARRLLGAVGLVGHEHRRFLTLSGGERQRVNLARVLAQLERPGDADAGYLFLDEPTAGLDLGLQERVLALAAAFARAGNGVVVVLHDLSLAARFADHVVLLAAGRVRAAGPPERVLTPAHIDAVFGCEALVFELDGRIASIVGAQRA